MEFDLVTVEDDVVFGSLVRLAPRADAHLNGVSERIIVRREANVLDHALVVPGCVVGERAVLGTFSLGAARQVFQPGSVATGNKKGQAVVLRKRPELPSGTTPLALLEAEARRRHKSIRWTLLWNTVNILVAAILYPLRDVFEVCIISCGYMLYFYLSWDGYYAYLGCLPLLSAVTAFLHCILVVLLKKVIIGKFARGDHGFYSRYHFCWALMMTLLAPVYPLIEAMHGTVLAVWFYRAMGACVGARACVHGKALEFDLLNVAEGASMDACAIPAPRWSIVIARRRVYRSGGRRRAVGRHAGRLVRRRRCLYRLRSSRAAASAVRPTRGCRGGRISERRRTPTRTSAPVV